MEKGAEIGKLEVLTGLMGSFAWSILPNS